MERRSVVSISPFLSIVSPKTLKTRPSSFSPTGTRKGAPVSITRSPRASPLEGGEDDAADEFIIQVTEDLDDDPAVFTGFQLVVNVRKMIRKPGDDDAAPDRDN